VAWSCGAHSARFIFQEIGLPVQGHEIHEAEHTFTPEPGREEGLDSSQVFRVFPTGVLNSMVGGSQEW
jgi:hypothetical protein